MSLTRPRTSFPSHRTPISSSVRLTRITDGKAVGMATAGIGTHGGDRIDTIGGAAVPGGNASKAAGKMPSGGRGSSPGGGATAGGADGGDAAFIELTRSGPFIAASDGAISFLWGVSGVLAGSFSLPEELPTELPPLAAGEAKGDCAEDTDRTTEASLGDSDDDAEDFVGASSTWCERSPTLTVMRAN